MYMDADSADEILFRTSSGICALRMRSSSGHCRTTDPVVMPRRRRSAKAAHAGQAEGRSHPDDHYRILWKPEMPSLIQQEHDHVDDKPKEREHETRRSNESFPPPGQPVGGTHEQSYSGDNGFTHAWSAHGTGSRIHWQGTRSAD